MIIEEQIAQVHGMFLVTYKEQARNTSKNRCFELNGKIKCAAEWCEELGIKSSTFFQRLKNGLNPFTGERV